MADEREALVVSDTENSEKSTREQLKKATISKAAGEAQVAGDVEIKDTVTSEPNGEASARDELQFDITDQDRSHGNDKESTEETIMPVTRHHTRKRSRDSTVEEEELNNGQRKSGERARSDTEVDDTANGAPKPPPTERSHTPEQTGDKRSEAAVEAMTSPKSKRSRLEPESEEPKAEQRETKKQTSIGVSKAMSETTLTSTGPSGSGFTNTSASSPFASLTGAKSPPPATAQTSSSAFAASTFGSLSGSASSGFGALGKTSGGFGSGGSFASSSTTTKTEAPTTGSAFGGALGQQSVFNASTSPKSTTASVFASPPSGFGTLGSTSAFSSSGFGTLGGGSGLTSFASGNPSSSLAGPSKPSRPFGAAPDEAEDADAAPDEADSESGFKSPLSQSESDKQDDRFYLQDLETGEEEEQTDYSCRAKLYNFVTGAEGKKEWKERGLGVVRLNARRVGSVEDYKPTARLLMRADGSHRVILNTPVKKELKFGAPAGGPPTGGYIYFMGAVDGATGLEMLQLKVSWMPQCDTERRC